MPNGVLKYSSFSKLISNLHILPFLCIDISNAIFVNEGCFANNNFPRFITFDLHFYIYRTAQLQYDYILFM